MNRSDIPAVLRVSRADDVARIPVTALAKMTPADVAPRLLAADEFRRRASESHLDADLYRYRVGQASEVLTTTDPKRAAALMKAAGVPFAGHEPMSGTHSHSHPAFGSQGGDQEHEHEHSHSGDADHRHYADHARVTAGKSSAPSTQLRKAAPPAPARQGRQLAEGEWKVEADGGPPVVVKVPVLKALASDSAKVIERAGNAGQLGALAREIASVAAAWGESESLAKAARYEQQAAVVADPAAREAYLQLARREREKEGAR